MRKIVLYALQQTDFIFHNQYFHRRKIASFAVEKKFMANYRMSSDFVFNFIEEAVSIIF